jgi:hypothetical protein
MAQVVSFRLLTAETRVPSTGSSCRPTVSSNKVAVGQAFLRVLWFSLVNIIPPLFLLTQVFSGRGRSSGRANLNLDHLEAEIVSSNPA